MITFTLCLLSFVLGYRLRRNRKAQPVKIHITLNGNDFDVETTAEENVQIDDDFIALFRTWVNALNTDAVKLEELTDRLKASNTRLESSVERNSKGD